MLNKPLKYGQPLLKEKKKRVWEIDAIRGFCILLMCIDHLMFDFGSMNAFFSNFWKVDNAFFEFMFDFARYHYWEEQWRIAIRIVAVSVFFYLSGISGTFSKNNISRCIKLIAAACILSGVTVLVDQVLDMGITILFGVLQCLALCVLLYVIIKAAAKEKAKYVFIGLGIAVTLSATLFDYYNLPVFIKAPNFLQMIEIMFGFKGYGADYFGLFPYFGLFLLGAAAGEIVYIRRETLLPKLDKKWKNPLAFVGRNTLWVYLLHQPILIVLFSLVALMAGYRF